MLSSMVLTLMTNVKSMPNVMIVDSKTNSTVTYVIVNDCIVPIEKKNLKDLQNVIKKVSDQCDLDLDLK